MRVYVDTSSAAKLLFAEQGSDVVVQLLDHPATEAVSTDLLETELRRAATRLGAGQAAVAAILDGVVLYALERPDFRAAGGLPGQNLRSLDALHLQGALSLDADAVLTFDARLAESASALGLAVLPES